VLMDGQMPRMDGYEATRLLRERENSETETFRTPVVAMTAHASLQDRQRCFTVGMDDYLSKPFKIEQLRCILEHWLPGSADLPENACEAVPGLHNPWAPGNVPQFQGLVLVVEDDLVIQELVVEMIEGFGCRADAVASGRQALDALTQRHYDMVLMDYEMPDMDGAEATRVIREREASDPTQAHVPIIATTGHGSGAFREKCLTAGMDDHLGKPFVLEKLLAILQRWLLKTAPDRCSAAIRAAADVTAIVGAPEVASIFISKGSAAAAKKAEWSLNHEALNNLRALQRPGSPDLLERLVASYLKDTPPMLERFRDAFLRDDHELACSIAHSLKSSSAYLGAAHFSEMFKKIESLARSNALGSAREMIPEVSDEFERVRQALLHEI
jgi:CheY-like chemotaxis protein/HPt (histidine-containing phosphotransfer) domain-containing protein